MFEKLIRTIENNLKRPLPGVEAQLKMAPYYDDVKARYSLQSAPVKRGSVLLLLYPDLEKICIPLMQRPNYDGVHGGQISFPGGKIEEGDADLIATALRETREEIGVPEKQIKILGTLTELFIPASNFTVLPVVGYSKSKPEFLPDPYEVVAVIESSLDELLDVTRVKYQNIKVRTGIEITAPYFDIQGHVVWGATAMIISEFLYLVKELRPNFGQN